MELIILLALAILVGYLLAGSRYSKPIDQAGQKISETSRSWTERLRGWWKGRFKKGEAAPQPGEATTTSDAVVIEAEPRPAEKQPSRRKSEESEN